MLARVLRLGAAVPVAVALVLSGAVAPAAAEGTGSISGTVLGPDGVPVEGACVRAQVYGYSAERARTTTAPDGSFRLTDVPAGRVLLLADPCAATANVAPQWYRGQLVYDNAQAVVVPDGGEVPGIDFDLVPGGSITGRVTTAEGEPLAGACVSSETVGTTEFLPRTTHTDADGRYRLDGVPQLSHRIRASGCAVSFPSTYAPGTDRESARTTTPDPGTVVSGMDIVVRPPADLTGRVLDTDGSPLQGQCVTLMAGGPNDYTFGTMTTASDGRWRFDDLAAGSYALRATDCATGLHLTRWYDGAAWVEQRTSFPVAEGATVTVADLSAPPAGAISGSVLDDTGAAVPQICAYVYADGQDSQYLESVRTGVTVEREGAYLLGGLVPGRYLVSVGTCQNGNYGQVWLGGDDRQSTATPVDVVAGQATAGNVVRPRAAYVGGTLRNELGQPARACATFEGFDIARSGEDGTYLSPPLYPRERVVGFAAACTDHRFGQGYATTSQTTVTLAPGETRTGVDGVVEAALSLSGTVRNPEGDGITACIRATAPGLAARDGRSDATGAWRLDGMEPGAWSILFTVCGQDGPNLLPTWHPGVPALTEAVPVPLGTTAVTGIDTVMREGARVTGVIRDANGMPYASACVTALRPVTGEHVSSTGGRTDEQGRYDLRALPPGAYVLLARHCGFGETPAGAPAPTYAPGTTSRLAEASPRTLLPGTNDPADIRMLPGGELRGSVVDSAGQPVAACLHLTTPEPWNTETRGAADGTFALRGLGTADRVTVRVTDCGAGTHATITLPSRSTAVGRIDDLGAVRLPLDATISGTLTRELSGEPVAAACVTTRADDLTDHYAVTDEQGRYTLRSLPPGSYVVQFSDCRGSAFVVPEYWDDALAPHLATPVTVAEDEDRTGVDARLITVTVPGVPREARTTVSDGVAQVTWREPEDDGHAPITSYVVRDAITGSVLATVPGSARSARLTGSPGVTVEAVNRRGAGPRTSLVPVVEGPPSPTGGPTPAPDLPPPSGSVPDIAPLPPKRVLDTRDGTGGISGRLAPGRPVDLQVSGRGGLPPGPEVKAVLLNTTATGASSAGHLTVFPGGQAAPLASSLNYGRGQTVANLVLVPVGPDGTVRLLSNAGSPHVVADVVGYVSASSPSALVPLRPARVLDSRDGTGGVAGRLSPGMAAQLPVLGRGGVPSSGVRAVLLNTTATGASAAGHLTVFPGGARVPLASSLNYARGTTVANLVLVPVGADGTVRLLANAGSPHVVADVVGYVAESSAAALRPLPPARVLDTRNSTGGVPGRLVPGRHVVVHVTGRGGVPMTGVRAVLLNTTVTGATRAGHLTVYPGNAAIPLASNLNHAAGQTVANLVVVPVAQDGTIRMLSNDGTPHVIADVVGWVAAG